LAAIFTAFLGTAFLARNQNVMLDAPDPFLGGKSSSNFFFCLFLENKSSKKYRLIFWGRKNLMTQ